MRTKPPHPLVKYRHWLAATALLCLGLAGLALVYFKQNPVFPIALVVGLLGLVFIWGNGIYWWVILRYPYIEVCKGQFASQDEWKDQNHLPFLRLYLAFAVVGSLACLNVALGYANH